ncbi:MULTISPECIES: transposase, partial [Salmonella]|uniref:transposase n=1 Tax=Salmonella TaxID=590 RepID=UPI003754E76B
SVRVGSHVVKQALLVAIGVDYSGNRHILDAEVANSEAEVNWRALLQIVGGDKLIIPFC